MLLQPNDATATWLLFENCVVTAVVLPTFSEWVVTEGLILYLSIYLNMYYCMCVYDNQVPFFYYFLQLAIFICDRGS